MTSFNLRSTQAQTAMEYLLALAVMTIIALTAFKVMIPRAYDQINGHYNMAVQNIAGPAANPNPGIFP